MNLVKYVLGICLTIFLTTSLAARELPDFTKLAEEYGPSVVNISTTAKKTKDSLRGELPKDNPFKDGPFHDFFKRFFDNEGNGFLEERPSTSLGSGFIISEDGYVITNNHVIDDAGEIIVRLSDRRELTAEVVGADKRSDIALLKIDANSLPAVKLGSSENLKVGEWVLAIGSPFGFEHSVTAGIVSAKGRSLPSDTYVPFIQTDVAINPGNSGGPLFNLDGEVIGVNAQIYSRTGGFMGLSFAIPVDVMKDVVDQLKNSGKVSRGWLGVLIQDVTHELAESFAMKKPQGALIARVLPESPAAEAGLKVGDIIVTFDGKQIERSVDLPPIVGRTKVNTTVSTIVIRKGKQEAINVNIGELPSEEDIKLATAAQGTANLDRIGLSITDLDDKKRETLSIVEGGVLVRNVEEGTARDAGVRKGDVIMMIDNTDVTDVIQFKEIVTGLGETTVPVLIHRHGSPLFLALKVPANDR
ncbi:DegQ family serine endoprotease [Candidatus Halobeggiatoa sp. HSG11]|nr:DegQ family serine endoprotease [Candidatus Halobeggiatoa sp. HSG11]